MPSLALPGTGDGQLLAYRGGGFVQVVNAGVLVRAARENGVFLRLLLQPGDHVVDGAPGAVGWRRDGEGEVPIEALEKAVKSAVHTGFERTSEQDAAFGLRQLTDIALKAISPGINDPVTAVHAVGHLTDLARRLRGSNDSCSPR